LVGEKEKLIESQLPIIGYILANYERFGEDALKVASDYFYGLGKFMGRSIKERMGIVESDANAVARVMNAILEEVIGIERVEGAPEPMRVEGDRVVGENAGFCPIMEAVKILNAPWDIVCRNYSWRWFEGLAAGVNPDVTMEVPKSRIWGQRRCLHIIKVPKRKAESR